MKNLFYTLSFLLIILFISACEKDKICTTSDPCAPTMRYFPMAIGNYWIYEVAHYDASTEIETITGKKDTIRIIGDTLIGSDLYYTFEKDQFVPSIVRKDTVYLRDSIGYIVNPQGDIIFTASGFSGLVYRRVLLQTPGANYYFRYSILDTLSLQTTPAGTFDCLDYSACLFLNGIKDPRVIHRYHSEDVGLVFENSFFVSSTIDMRRYLFEYHLED